MYQYCRTYIYTFIKKPKWLTATDQAINLYKQTVNMYLSELALPENIVSCKYFGCEKTEHMKMINFRYDSIIRLYTLIYAYIHCFGDKFGLSVTYHRTGLLS